MSNFGTLLDLTTNSWSFISVSLKCSSTMLVAWISGYSRISPLVLAMFTIFSSVQLCAISPNVFHVVLAPHKSMLWNIRGRVNPFSESSPSPSHVWVRVRSSHKSAVYLFSVRPRGLRPSEWRVVSANFFKSYVYIQWVYNDYICVSTVLFT